MKFLENTVLAPYTTFKIGGPAKFFCVVNNQFDALEAYEFAAKNQLKTFVLGGGSNVLISDDGFDGLVMKVENKGIEVIKEDANFVWLKVASGEIWDQVVSFAVKNNWWGIENLSHIPGSSGAIAVQNVGAYGQEASKLIESVTVFDRETHNINQLLNSECRFAYRQSIFNTSARGKYIIFYITFKLSKIHKPVLSYKDVAKYFGILTAASGHLPQEGESNKVLSLAEIRQAIINIRDTKFPFPTQAVKGNAGSFFKNPILSPAQYQELVGNIQAKFGDDYAKKLEDKKFSENDQIKVPAAFLIELCGLKDLVLGGAAINHNQPLVIINQTGQATAKDVLNLANKVKSEVLDKTGIALNFEPELIGFK